MRDVNLTATKCFDTDDNVSQGYDTSNYNYSALLHKKINKRNRNKGKTYSFNIGSHQK